MPIFDLPPTLMPCVRESLIAHAVASDPVVSRKIFCNPSGARDARMRVSARSASAAQSSRRLRIRAGGATDAQVDATGEERTEHAEELRDLQRRVVGEHDAAGAHADRLRHDADLADHDLGRGARERAGVVMLGEPIARRADGLRVTREVDGVSQGLGRVRAGRNR